MLADVGQDTVWLTEKSRLHSPLGLHSLLFAHRFQAGSEAHPTSYAVGMGKYFPGLKRSGLQADQSPQHIVQIRSGVYS
jgi:hypothetical protein